MRNTGCGLVTGVQKCALPRLCSVDDRGLARSRNRKIADVLRERQVIGGQQLLSVESAAGALAVDNLDELAELIGVELAVPNVERPGREILETRFLGLDTLKGVRNLTLCLDTDT